MGRVPGGNEMDKRVDWLKERYEEQDDDLKKYFSSYVLGVFQEESRQYPDKVYNVSDVAEIVKIINDSIFRH